MIDYPRVAGPWISVRDLGFSHGAHAVLRDIAFDLHSGRHYIIAGPNGAGKSTLLDILSKLKRPAAGKLRILERDAAEYSPGELARIMALAPQEFRLNFSFSIREIVAMGRRPYLDRWGRMNAEDARIVDRALRDTHLDAIAGRAVTALSGGERRRCIVARALAQTTPILLFDEPDSGLDIAQSLSVMALARKLAENGALVVTVSHDLNLAARYGHEFIFLKNGMLAASGPVEETFTNAVLSNIYETEARVGRDALSGGLTVSFRMRDDPV